MSEQNQTQEKEGRQHFCSFSWSHPRCLVTWVSSSPDAVLSTPIIWEAVAIQFFFFLQATFDLWHQKVFSRELPLIVYFLFLYQFSQIPIDDVVKEPH